MNLECSTKGDKRFSAFCAYVKHNGEYNTIENIYQLSKRFSDENKPKSWKECKGKTPTHFMIKDVRYDISLFSDWYEALWLKFFNDNKKMLSVIMEYDTFSDIFKGKSTNCQADVIRKIRFGNLNELIKQNRIYHLL